MHAARAEKEIKLSDIMELGQKLIFSFSIHEAVGDWRNEYKYNDGGEVKSEPYYIWLLLDCDHLFFHIGISINTLHDEFSTQFESIIQKSLELAKNKSKLELNSAVLHFTAKIFIICNEVKTDAVKMKDAFLKKGISLTVYKNDDPHIKIVSEVFKFIPSSMYEDDVIKQKKVNYVLTPNYSIWKHEDGTVSFQFQVIQHSDINTNRDRISDLSALSPYRYKVYQMLHSKKEKLKVQDRICSAIQDTFEGHKDEAIESLKQLDTELQVDRFYRNIGYTIIIGIVYGILELILFFFLKSNFFVKVALFGTIGSFLSLFVPLNYFKKTITYTKMQLIIEIIIRLIIGMTSGIVIGIAIKANIILGVFNNIGNDYLICLFAIASGFSEKFLPNFMKSIEEKINVDEERII